MVWKDAACREPAHGGAAVHATFGVNLEGRTDEISGGFGLKNAVMKRTHTKSKERFAAACIVRLGLSCPQLSDQILKGVN